MPIDPQFTRAESTAMHGRSLSGIHTRWLLGRDLPEIPEALITDADPYLLVIISAALLDGNEPRDADVPT